ncbi:MAG: CHAT domain-containing protein [Chroococcidiopsidaceae cyanobacterium CP_BM_ER_R8_30]|nr:CHAT domain-containing protein [Chroococcidiopsidaceae cyanobacterium CP_BM_ER_R8_30]
MARKRAVFFHHRQSLLSRLKSTRARLTVLAFLSTAFLVLCLGIEGLPVAARLPAVSSIVQIPTNASQLVQQGRELYEAGQFPQAITVWQQADTSFKAEKDVLNQAMVLSNLSLAYQQLGQWTQATATITDSLKLLQISPSVGDSKRRAQILAQVLNTQGSLQLSLGQTEAALATWQRATAAYVQAGDEVGVSRSLINEAQALQTLGLYVRASETLNQVNQTLKKQPDSPIKAAGLRRLGNALRLVGNLDQSQQILQQSLTVAEHLKSPLDIGESLFGLGNTARAQQNTQVALAFYQQAASVSSLIRLQAQLNQLSLLVETEQFSPAQALLPQIQSQIATLPLNQTAVYARIDLAVSLMKIGREGDLQTSAQLLATAVQQAQSLGDRRAEAYALGNLGGVYEQTHQWSIAQNLTQQALLIAQSLNASDIAYRWQWQLGRLLKAQRNTQAAIAAYDEAVQTLQSVRRDLVTINIEAQFSFRDQVEPVYRQLVDLLLPAQGNEPGQQNLIQARAAIQSLQLAELDNFFRSACLEAKSVLIDQVVDQDNLTAAVIYPILLPDRLEVIYKLPQQSQLHHYRIPVPQSQVEQTLGQLVQKITEPDTIKEVKSLAQQVHGWLVQPAEAELVKSNVKTLVFVLDGALRNIPLAALYDGKQYLVEKYAVALNLGLQLLNPKPVSTGRLKALAAGLSQPPQSLNFPALPEVKLEFNLIDQAGVSTKELLNQQFTSQNLKQNLNLSTFNIVHLATHGQFSSRAQDTFILAWDRPINVNELDILLRTREQSQSEALELLVLSACETATGDKRAALGLAGVAVQAGARSTLASLWHIDDEATAIFIGEFYRELAKNKVTKAEALRIAQLSLLQKYPNYKRPGYWAPYVLVGNWL